MKESDSPSARERWKTASSSNDQKKQTSNVVGEEKKRDTGGGGEGVRLVARKRTDRKHSGREKRGATPLKFAGKKDGPQ